MVSFVARQPILDRMQKVMGYELLFRSGFESMFRHPEPSQASSRLIADCVLLIDLETLTRGRKAFINVTQDTLVDELITVLPPKSTGVEILETVDPTPEVVAACAKLKRLGYTIALDDFRYDERFEPLVQLADIVKIDVIDTTPAERAAAVARFARSGTKLVAEKVETREVFDEARKAGFDYFQGYFFSRPVISSRRDIPGIKIHYLELLSEIRRPEQSVARLEAIIRRDVALGYKLLRFINSVHFGLRSKVGSIKHALMLLGEDEVRKWATLVAITSMAGDKPEELILQAVVRARTCESLADAAGIPQRSETLFLLGMFSLIDAILDQPVLDILETLPVDDEIRSALLGGENALRAVLDGVVAYEQGDWVSFNRRSDQIGFDQTIMPKIHIDALEWAHGSIPSLTAS